MSEPTLIWCHGSLSEPWGKKSKALAETAKSCGLTMEALDFQDLENADERAERLVKRLKELDGPIILAGSSMGGYVAAAAAKQVKTAGLFLLAPAFYFQGYALHVFTNLPEKVTVIHGWADDVVPVDNSLRFAKTHKADLHVFNDNHRLENSTDRLCAIFNRFLTTVTDQG
ncbi:YqiA/YcfP family alpha/beta fold hydrolase [uncultured Pseudodesulfovibrio sp.]|uniref:alpha/beta hydrolase n=1 Tax=uncultured Pseudodesulfovibrio sp. TaxID=2035858 RepID=UPI0029C86598|nr:YqiA/YcfP family alpha/beta fold hydrolase [uncultured Pseudodesulfovibrio sp.]